MLQRLKIIMNCIEICENIVSFPSYNLLRSRKTNTETLDINPLVQPIQIIDSRSQILFFT